VDRGDGRRGAGAVHLASSGLDAHHQRPWRGSWHGSAALAVATLGRYPMVTVEILDNLTRDDRAALLRAVQLLEHPGLAARLASMVGRPIELIGRVLPASAAQVITGATTKGLEVALQVALRTMRRAPHPGSQLLHKALAAASGAAGGAFGLATLPI